MLLATVTDSVKCRAFPTTLKGLVMVWYSHLPSNYIFSFDDLAARLSVQFATSWVHQKTSATLVNFRQGPSESLWEFMTRFIKETLLIRDLSPPVALHAILTGLRHGPFVDSLARKPPANIDELRRRENGYITLEEVASSRLGVELEIVPCAQEESHRRNNDKGKNEPRWYKREKQSKYDSYTPLVAWRSDLLNDVCHTDLLELSPSGKTPRWADRSKHCEYHRNYGHNTEECRTLKDDIEKLIRKGHLGWYVNINNEDRSDERINRDRSLGLRQERRHRDDRSE